VILVFDTETTGLPLFRQPSEHPDQPHMVDVCGLLIEPEFQPGGVRWRVVDEFEALVRPSNWEISAEVSKIHGITHDQAMAEGILESDAIEALLALQARAELRVAHNESFDQRIVRIALHRYRDPAAIEAWAAAPTFCTCEAAKPILKLPPTEKMIRAGFGKQFKSPNLAEAFKHFTGEDLIGAHRARADAEACARIYFAMHPPVPTEAAAAAA
jgi:DNA polymerase III epsilon subunit-like protein